MKMSRVLCSGLLALAMLPGLGTSVFAAEGTQASTAQLRRAVLTLSVITNAANQGNRAESSGVACDKSTQIGATFCLQDGLYSTAAQDSGLPWANHVNVFSFKSVADARKYVAQMKKRYQSATLYSASATKVVGLDTEAMITSGMSFRPGPELSIVQAVGTFAFWVSCADPTQTSSAKELYQCALGLAQAQSTKLR